MAVKECSSLLYESFIFRAEMTCFIFEYKFPVFKDYGPQSINTSGTNFSNNIEHINTHYVNGRIDSRLEVL